LQAATPVDVSVIIITTSELLLIPEELLEVLERIEAILENRPRPPHDFRG
jgi:hypothetical protein